MVSSEDFRAALERVPPSLTRGMQIVSETGTSQTMRKANLWVIVVA